MTTFDEWDHVTKGIDESKRRLETSLNEVTEGNEMMRSLIASEEDCDFREVEKQYSAIIDDALESIEHTLNATQQRLYWITDFAICENINRSILESDATAELKLQSVDTYLNDYLSELLAEMGLRCGDAYRVMGQARSLHSNYSLAQIFDNKSKSPPT